MQTLDSSAIKFADFVRSKREEKTLSVQAIADGAGLSRAFIYLIQDKLTQPSISSATRILGAIGESWESFAKYINEAA